MLYTAVCEQKLICWCVCLQLYYYLNTYPYFFTPLAITIFLRFCHTHILKLINKGKTYIDFVGRSISAKLPTPPTVSVPFNQLWLNCFSWRHNARSEIEGHEKVIAMKLLVSSSTRSWLLLKPASFQLGDLQIESLHYIRYDHLKKATWLWLVFTTYGVLDLDPWTLSCPCLS